MRRKLLLLLLPVLILLPVMLDRSTRTPEAKAVNRLIAEAKAAKSKVPEESEGGGVEHLEDFARDMRAIDLGGVPSDVRFATEDFIRAIEANVATRRVGGDTNAADAKWSKAQKAWFRAIQRYTTQPF